MKQTSLDAYADMKASGKIQTHADRIIKTLELFKAGASADMIVRLSGLSKPQVSRRMKELVIDGRVKELGTQNCRIINRRVTWYEVV